MLERYITPLLTSYLDKYVKNIQPTDLQLSFWGGDAVLRNLELRLDVLEKEFGYPLALQSGHIKELRIHVPWTTLGSEPVEISISDVEIVAIVKESWSSGADKSGSQDLSSEVKETIKKTELKQGVYVVWIRCCEVSWSYCVINISFFDCHCTCNVISAAPVSCVMHCLHCAYVRACVHR